MTGACYNVALTCGYAVFAYDSALDVCLNSESGTTDKMCVVDHISDVFYQSLLCPENSTYYIAGIPDNVKVLAGFNRIIEGWVNSSCKCDAGYSVWNGACLAACNDDNNEYRNTLGVCEVCDSTLFYPSEPTPCTGCGDYAPEADACQIL